MADNRTSVKRRSAWAMNPCECGHGYLEHPYDGDGCRVCECPWSVVYAPPPASGWRWDEATQTLRREAGGHGA